MMYPTDTPALLLAMFPTATPNVDYRLGVAADGSIIIEYWSVDLGQQPTPEQVIAYHNGPEYLAHVRGQRATQLIAERQAALTARMGETWPGLSAGEVAISIAAQEPSASDVSAYLADRQTILAAHVAAVEALDTMTLEQLEAAIAAGGA